MGSSGLLFNPARKEVTIMSTLDELAAALNDHQVTDDEGQIKEETTSTDETATQEENTVEEPAQAEKPEESEVEEPKTPTEDDEIDLVELAADDTGKRYVPEKRFKEVYGKLKATERELAKNKVPEVIEPITKPATVPLNKADALEIELLRSIMPQFNPESTEYSRELDELGFSIYEGAKDKSGNYSMTRTEAARKALQWAKRITS